MYAWFDLGDGRQVYRKVTDAPKARSHLPMPMIVNDTIEPLQSMADGKFYTSKAAMRASYRPSGNPQGASYTEIGNEYEKTPYKKPEPKVDPASIDAALNKALSRYQAGDRPKA